MLSPFEWWCRNFILPDICKPCLFVFLRNLFYLTRRQSRDRAVCARILEDAAGRRLWMSRDTLRLFEAPYPEYLTAAEDFLAQAGPGELCFVEEPPLLPWLDRLEGLVLYRWNRRYPADAWLDVRPGPPGWTLARREEFSGHSHERITKEVYTR